MELIVFIAIVGVGLSVFVKAFSGQAQNSIDPMAHLKAVECAQAQMEDIMARSYDGNKINGGIPACGSDAFQDASGVWADCDAAPNSAMDDLMDYTLSSWKPNNVFFAGCTIDVKVANQGEDFKYLKSMNAGHAGKKLDFLQARLITVTATVGSESYALKAYRINF